jgi:hypothetical protein
MLRSQILSFRFNNLTNKWYLGYHRVLLGIVEYYEVLWDIGMMVILIIQTSKGTDK